jgi:hypothetical protein
LTPLARAASIIKSHSFNSWPSVLDRDVLFGLASLNRHLAVKMMGNQQLDAGNAWIG